MKANNLKTVALLVLLASVFTSIVSMESRAQGAEQTRVCYGLYKQLYDNANSNPVLAASAGKRFLSDDCGKSYPSLTGSATKYLSWYNEEYLPWLNQQKGNPATTNIAGTGTSQNRTVASANNGAISCPQSDDLRGTSQEAIFKRQIADRYEKDGRSRIEKRVGASINFIDFKVGVSHPYRQMVKNPDGPGGVEGAAVYAVKATYRVCYDHPGFAPTGYKGELQTIDFEKMTYSCFKDDTGDWVCNQTGGQQSMPQRTAK